MDWLWNAWTRSHSNAGMLEPRVVIVVILVIPVILDVLAKLVILVILVYSCLF